MGHHLILNAEFENMTRLRREYESSGDAVISIDTKVKGSSLEASMVLAIRSLL